MSFPGRNLKFGQLSMLKDSKEVRLRKPLEDKISSFGKFTMLRWVREEGNVIPISSCGNDTTSGHPFDIHRDLREVSLCNPH